MSRQNNSVSKLGKIVLSTALALGGLGLTDCSKEKGMYQDFAPNHKVEYPMTPEEKAKEERILREVEEGKTQLYRPENMLDRVIINVDGEENILLRKTSEENYKLINEEGHKTTYEGQKGELNAKICYTINSSGEVRYNIILENEKGDIGGDISNRPYSPANNILLENKNLVVRIMEDAFAGKDKPSEIVRHGDPKSYIDLNYP